MPHIIVKLLEGKTEEQKRKLALELVKTAQSIIGYGQESFSVSIEDFTLEEWKTKIYLNEIMANKPKLYKNPGYSM